jgi:type IV secretion system protein VirD4
VSPTFSTPTTVGASERRSATVTTGLSANLDSRARSGNRGVYLGVGARGWAWTGAERSTLVLGPSRSGKTSALVVTNVLAARGAVVSTSTKPDVLRETAGTRAAAGWCCVFDPTGEVELPAGVHRVGWSPVTGATGWAGAIEVADAMVRTARGRPAGGAAGAEGHWTERAAALLAPLLHAASLDGVSMRRVLHWVDRHDGAPALDTLAARLGDDAVPTDLLAGILSTDEREQSGIWSTASGALAAYRSPGALASTEGPLLDPEAFCAGAHTLYVCAPAARQQLLAPLVVAMLSQVRDAAYRRAADHDAHHQPPVLFALDEVANIAPLPDLPSLVTDGPGQGLLTLACLQDLSQARARWGDEADAFVSIFGATVVLGGIADMRTLEALSALSGDREVHSRSVGITEGAGGRQLSSTDAAVLRRRLPVDVVARGVAGWALCVDARNRLGWVRLTPAHDAWPWRAWVGTDPQRARRAPDRHSPLPVVGGVRDRTR